MTESAVTVASSEVRGTLVRRAQTLAWAGIGWHLIEFAVAVGAGVAASSIALIGFGLDSLIELFVALIVIWRFSASRSSSPSAERRAQRMLAVSFFLLAAYVWVEATRSLVLGLHPEVSWLGMALAAAAMPTMVLLARAKRRVGERLGSGVTVGEGIQNLLCAYLSVGLLIGLGLNALFGYWWADPVAAAAIGVVAVREGLESWKGRDCCGSCRQKGRE